MIPEALSMQAGISREARGVHRLALNLGDGYTLEPDSGELSLRWRGEEIARPFCSVYAARVISQHRPFVPWERRG